MPFTSPTLPSFENQLQNTSSIAHGRELSFSDSRFSPIDNNPFTEPYSPDRRPTRRPVEGGLSMDLQSAALSSDPVPKFQRAIDLFPKFACPYAKSNLEKYRTCRIIGRANLSGVKEHIKRNHSNGKLPHRVRLSRTWEDVYRVLFPKRADIPSPFITRTIDDANFEDGVVDLPQNLSMPLEPVDDSSAFDTMDSVFETMPLGNSTSLENIRQGQRRSPSLGFHSPTLTPFNTRGYSPTQRETSGYGEPCSELYGGCARNLSERYHNSEGTYTLCIARGPERFISSETRCPKRFFFEDFDSLYQNFEPWMAINFYDPMFSWDLWELANCQRNSSISSIEELIGELEFHFFCYRTNKLALLLVPKLVDVLVRM